MKRKIDMKKTGTKACSTEQVDEFMAGFDHPFKAEVEQVREIIKNVNKDITEQIKWKMIARIIPWCIGRSRRDSARLLELFLSFGGFSFPSLFLPRRR
jgi:hypothetical protein